MDNEEEYSIDISTTLSNTITLNVPSTPSIGDIHFDTNSMDVKIYGNNGDWLTVSDNGSVAWDNIYVTPVVFENTMPDFNEVKAMCEEYPGLEKAYENFKTFYKLVEQDWRGKQKERGDLF